MDEPLPCPLCGDVMRELVEDVFVHTDAASEIMPPDSRCMLRHYHVHRELLPNWNSRPTPAGVSELADELERLVARRSEPAKMMKMDHPQALPVAIATANEIDRSIAEKIEGDLPTILTALRSMDRGEEGK